MKKHYIGSITSESKAARIYDRHAIMTHGLRAKTNYSYTKTEIEQILVNEKDDIFEDSDGSHKELKTNDGCDEYSASNIASMSIEISNNKDTKPHMSESNEILMVG